MTEVEGWPLCLQLVPGVNFLNEPLRVVVDRGEASLATRDRLCRLGSLSVGHLCAVVERMEPAGCDMYTSTLGQAIELNHSLRRTPEGLRRPEVATAAQVLLQKSIDAHRDNPGAGFIVVEAAKDFGEEGAEMFSVRSQAWMPALQCRLELEAAATAGLVISPQADVLATFSFPENVSWGTLDGPVHDDALGALLEGTEALVLMESLPSGYTHLDGDSLGRLQEILEHAYITPIVPED